MRLRFRARRDVGVAVVGAERALEEAGAENAVAIFAQATAGDVSPHYQGPGDIARRASIRGSAEYAYAEANGRVQSERALSLLARGDERRLDGGVDAIFGYFDFTAIHADPRFAGGDPDAWTSDPCHGVAFFRGTRVDGPGLPGPVGMIAESIARAVRARRLNGLVRLPPEERAYYRHLYAAQGPKSILMEAGRKLLLGGTLAKTRLPDFIDPAVKELKRQARIGAIGESALVPTVLPLQIVTIGQVALVSCPGEFTTTAGRRLLQAVEADLRARGATELLICTYCNDYMGYTTTREEYQEQCYEGGHTIFGQWQLAAFQTRFAELARELRKPEPERGHDRTTRPRPAPADELALRADLPVPSYFKLA